MNMNKFTPIFLAILAVNQIPITPAHGQSAYFQAMTNLHPTAYWPMHETAPAARGSMETNYGTLGSLGDGYYADWAFGTNVNRQVAGALAHDPDPATGFQGKNPSWLLVPRTSPQVSLLPPFTI